MKAKLCMPNGSHYAIWYNPKPVPMRIAQDWDWVSSEYDGPGDCRGGCSKTFGEAVEGALGAEELWIEEYEEVIS